MIDNIIFILSIIALSGVVGGVCSAFLNTIFMAFEKRNRKKHKIEIQNLIEKFKQDMKSREEVIDILHSEMNEYSSLYESAKNAGEALRYAGAMEVLDKLLIKISEKENSNGKDFE